MTSTNLQKATLRGVSYEERDMFEKMIALLPDEVKKAINEGKLQTDEVSYFNTKKVGTNDTIDIFTPLSLDKIGVTNFATSVVPTNKPFLLTKLMLQYSFAEISDVKFKDSFPPMNLFNGEFEIKIDGKAVIKNGSQVFLNPLNNYLNGNILTFVLPLQAPKWCLSGNKLDFVIKLAEPLDAAPEGFEHKVKGTALGIGFNSI